MHCMKCGVEIPAEQVFCDSCLSGMQKHPVKPETPVVLPPKAFTPVPKRTGTHHRRPRRQEDGLTRLRIRLRLLACVCLLLTAALAVSASYIVHLKNQSEPKPPDPGQNYSTGSITTTPSRTIPSNHTIS